MNSIVLAAMTRPFFSSTPHFGEPTAPEREDLPMSEDQEQSSPTPTRAR